MEQTWTTWTGTLPWWYRAVPGKLARHQQLMLSTVTDFFSFTILLKTLFQPWRRDEIATDRLSLNERFQVWGLNLITRLFGFVIRSIAIVSGVVTLGALLLFFIFLWATWLFAPLVALALILLGLATVFGVTQ